MESKDKQESKYERRSSSYAGVRFRLSKTRKHGIRPDRYFIIRYKKDGRLYEEAAGWSSEGMDAEEASRLLGIIKQNIRLGQRPQSLAEMRQMKKEEKEREEHDCKEKAARLVTVNKFWNEVYYPEKQRYKKTSTMNTEKYLFKKWIEPTLGMCPIQELSEEHASAVQLAAIKARLKASSTRFIMCVLSQIWAYACVKKIVKGDNPILRVPPLKEDNRRIRFLTKEEANMLLDAFGKKLRNTHDIVLMSLLTGMRAGEIFGLKCGKVNFDSGYIHITDTKTGMNRVAFMMPELREMLHARCDGQSPDELVFPGRLGKKRTEVPDSYSQMVEKLMFNKGVQDARDKVVFHTLRHTFASWLVQKGVPLYTVAELMGHTTLAMTKRYSHLAPEHLKTASMMLSGEVDVACAISKLRS